MEDPVSRLLCSIWALVEDLSSEDIVWILCGGNVVFACFSFNAFDEYTRMRSYGLSCRTGIQF